MIKANKKWYVISNYHSFCRLNPVMMNVEENLSCECAVLSFTREMSGNNPQPIKEVSIGLAPLSASVASFGQKSFNKMMEETPGSLVGKQPLSDRHQRHRLQPNSRFQLSDKVPKN